MKTIIQADTKSLRASSEERQARAEQSLRKHSRIRAMLIAIPIALAGCALYLLLK